MLPDNLSNTGFYIGIIVILCVPAKNLSAMLIASTYLNQSAIAKITKFNVGNVQGIRRWIAWGKG